jgi:hypothetical protein
MTERLLQYIWQFQYFNKRPLILDNGDEFQIIHPGRYNTNQGPDFLEAKIKIEETLWVGHVELHLKTSDWFKHKHQLDRNYDNVVLHVVWENDQPDKDSRIPVFSLQSRVPRILLQQVENWMSSESGIPCGQQGQNLPRIIWIGWQERLSAERLQRKTLKVFSCLEKNNQHWEETFWWMLARNFGTTVNAELFEAMAQSLPLTLLARHKNQIHAIEALLLGQCGMLKEKFEDDYPIMLQKEYLHLKNKYNLQPVRQPVNKSCMRPENFPMVRLAQLAMLIHQSSHLFAYIKDTLEITDIKKMLAVTANDFWHYHYTLQKQSAYKPKTLGKQMINNIIINTIVPVLFSYGAWHSLEAYKNKALSWLGSLPPEDNNYTDSFKDLGIGYNENANHSQALIQLKKIYCDEKRCLNCSIANALLKRQFAEVQLQV